MCYFLSLAEAEIKLQKRYNARFEKYGKLKLQRIINGYSFPEIPVLTNEFPQLFRFFKWGLIPNWIKTKNEAMEIRKMTLNAKIETVFDKPSFSSSAKYNRCLIPVNGFYEWQHQGKNKIKFFINLAEQEIYSLGGIWSTWTDRDTGEEIHSFSILTMPANNLMEKIHNTKKRMPVILTKDFELEWIRNDLNKNDIIELAHLCPEDIMRAHQCH